MILKNISRREMKHEYGVYASRMKDVFSTVNFPFSSAVVEIEQDQTITRHNHEEHEIYMITQGDGIMHVDEQSFEVQAGDVIYVHPHEQHALTNPHPHLLKITSFWWFAP